MKIFEENGIFLTNGMTEQEIQVAESCYNIEFSAEYRKFISISLPLYDEDYTDWRNTLEKHVSSMGGITTIVADWVKLIVSNDENSKSNV